MGILFRTFLDFSFSLPLIDLDHLRSQFFRLSWWSFPPPKKKSPEIPVFPTILGVLPQKKKNSRDPSFSHYLGGPSPPKKKSPEIPVFPTILRFLLQKQKKFSRDPSFYHYLGVPSPPHKKNLQRSQFFPLSWGFFSKKKNPQKSQFFLLSGGPSPQKNLQRSQFFPLSWWSFPPPKKKKSPEIPVFPTILVVLPPESFSRDPSFSHYLGGPSSKKKKISRDPSFSHYLGGPSPPKKNLQRSQFFPLSWWSFPQKVSPEIPVFPTILGVLPKKNFSRDPSFSHWGSFPPKKKKKSQAIPAFPTIVVVLPPSKKKKNFSRDPTFFHYLGVPSPEIPAFPTILGVLPPSKKKNLKKSYFFPLFWRLFSKNFLQRSHFFPLSWGPPPKKKKKPKRHQGWG